MSGARLRQGLKPRSDRHSLFKAGPSISDGCWVAPPQVNQGLTDGASSRLAMWGARIRLGLNRRSGTRRLFKADPSISDGCWVAPPQVNQGLTDGASSRLEVSGLLDGLVSWIGGVWLGAFG
jgi:hypothetical protein